MNYDPSSREAYWQQWWRDNKTYDISLEDDSKPKYYNLTMFPYPSGDKLHIGHWYNYAPVDSWGRFMKMRGYNVFQPLGFDSFGLPAENHAIKTGVPPRESTMGNIDTMRKQLSAMGAMWHWDYEVVTSEPDYYQWTQLIFLKLYEKGLAYKKKALVNWCPSCQTVLANEQVVDGACERCKNEVTKKDLEQWFFRITDYAEDLLDHSQLDWPEKTKLMQKHWIGRSEGAEIDFEVANNPSKHLRVYTTRPDTLFGTTFVVMAPEHPMVKELTTAEQETEVSAYIQTAMTTSEIDRTNAERPKTGVFTGSYVINPATKQEIPVWIADFALVHYGTGIVMATPGHDERDHQFATKYNLPIKQVVKPADASDIDINKEAYTEYGIACNSEFLDGLATKEAIAKMLNWLEENKKGERKVNYKLRDWLISRQRYWGAPIPIVYDPQGNAHAVPEEHLPWMLPTDVEFKPTGTSPLAQSKEFIERTEKIFGEGWRPEFDTMDTFMCSSWYYLRYPDALNKDAICDKMAAKWMQVDMYIGGPEHACMHLLYARFVNMALHDLGIAPTKEPFKKLVHQGMITKDGAKMSKSKGNVVSPDQFVEKYGSDVFRMYLMFMGPFTEGGDWSDKGITGIARFQQRLYKALTTAKINDKADDLTDLTAELHKTIAKVTADLENMQYNTAIAALMELTNAINKKPELSSEIRDTIIKLLSPMAPHFAEELWHHAGHTDSVFEQDWPTADASKLVTSSLTYVVQINGKLRDEFTALPELTEAEALEIALKLPKVASQLEGKEIVKTIFVPKKLVSFVVKG